jgi:predicted enzyme related to lactoylglutathione lyase
MAQAIATKVNRPAWVELATSDTTSASEFYSKLFGWQVEVSPDPQYGGYGIAKLGGVDAAGITPKQSTEAPNAWGLYIGADDVDAIADRVKSAGGTVVAAPFDVGDQGRMAVFQDPAGAFISVWKGSQMRGFETDAPNAYGWAELNARGVDKAIPFYTQLFGWTTRKSEMSEGQPPYTEFLIGDESVAGAWEMNRQIPADTPSYWQVYFVAEDVDAAHRRALDLGATEMLPPQDFPGGRFAIVADPQGASFGLLKVSYSS